MRRFYFILVASLGVLALAACSDSSNDDTTKKDKGPVQIDGGTNDTGGTKNEVGAGDTGGLVPDKTVKTDANLCDKTIIGKACTDSGGECGNAHTCLLTASDGKSGLCTCICTPDDSSTSLFNEDSCPGAKSTPADSKCGSVALSDGTTKNMCFKVCSPKLGSNACATGIACHPRAGGAVGIYPETVCLYAGCAKNSDCGVNSGTACDTTTKNCPTGEVCYALNSAVSTAGLCYADGLCDTKSGLCKPHTLGKSTAKIGDACNSDKECGGAMSCQIELDQTKIYSAAGGVCTDDSDCCLGGTCTAKKCVGGDCTVKLRRNGYCAQTGCSFSKTLTEFACPTGSACNGLFYGGFCFQSCDVTKTSGAQSCRSNPADRFGDYECRVWSNVFKAEYVPTPFCEWGTLIGCSDFQSSSISCAYFGDKSNSTNMSCRDMKNTKLSTYATNGWCFDDTASGPVDGTDAGVVTPDAGVVTPDSAVVTPDSAVVTPDSAVVTPDSAVVAPDAGPGID